MQEYGIDLIKVALFSTLIIIGFTFFIFYLLIHIKQRNVKIENSLIELKHKHEKDTLSAQLEVQEETFKRISKDIHDNISLNLTLAKLYLTSFFKNDSNSEDRNVVSLSVDLISKSLIDLNDLSKSLDGEIIKKNGLIYAIENELIFLRKVNHINFKYELLGKTYFLEWDIELMIFRILQESIRNSINHSNCKNVNISLKYFENGLSLEIIDDGCGFNYIDATEKKNSSSGIRNMQNRSSLIKGNFSINSTISSGTRILLEVPKNNI